LHPDEQALLVNWYNSLTSHGALSWNVGNDLCGQAGVQCDSSTPYQRVIKMYPVGKSVAGLSRKMIIKKLAK